MTAATSTEDPQQIVGSANESNPLPRLQRNMLHHAIAAKTKFDLLQALVQLLGGCAQPLAAFYFQRDPHGDLRASIRLCPTDEDRSFHRLEKELLSASQNACRSGEVERQRRLSHTLVAAPVVLSGRAPEAIGVAFSSETAPDLAMLLTQMAASHLVLAELLTVSRGHQNDARDAAALVELQTRVIAAPNFRQACYTLVAELQAYLSCRRVALGMRSSGRGRCRLTAVSGTAHFDKRSQIAQALEAAMDEAVSRGEPTHWPARNEQQRHAAFAHKQLCSAADCQAVLSVPLCDQESNVVAVLVLLEDQEAALSEATRLLGAADKALAETLTAVQRWDKGAFAKLTSAAGAACGTVKGKIALALALLAMFSLLLPLPHQVHCDCQIEPVTRRFVVAPFECSLEESFVKPGDLVRKGDLLARLDGRELRWKRAASAADQSQAIKRRDAAQATRNYADQQIAQLEFERLELELQLLDHRTANLEIRSPLDGVVVSGDLERAEGAALTIGQTLFEIAPLESMIVEAAAPDDQVAYVAAGQTLEIRLDSYPNQVWKAEAARIHPRSEIRDEENVFIIEAELDNADGRLRPGMKGRVKVHAGQRSLGWLLFHRPWEYVVKQLHW